MQTSLPSAVDCVPLQQALLAAVRASDQSRFLHRIHCVALVLSGMTCGDVARVFGGETRSVQRWVRSYKTSGVCGLEEAKRTGRPTALPGSALVELQRVVVNPPELLNHPAAAWSSTLLQAEIARRFEVRLSKRQCQRLLAKLMAPAPHK